MIRSPDIEPSLADGSARPGARTRGLPRWAYAADFLATFLGFLAVVVYFSGGFRTWFGSVHVVFTSPGRLLAAAIVVAIARHALEPAPPIHRVFAGALRRWWSEPGVRAAVAVLVTTRLVVMLIGYLAIFQIGYGPGEAPLRFSENELINLPVRWDAGWYLQIAVEGYSYIPRRPDLQQNIVFFPAYPGLVKAVGLVLGNRDIPYVLAAVVVSLAAWLGALIYLYGLAREFLSDDQAWSVLWLIGAYPFAIFYGGIYTESLFLLAATGAFFHFNRRQWAQAAGWGLVAGLTRPNGCFLAAALAIAAVAPVLPSPVAGGSLRSTARDLRRTGRGRVEPVALATALVPILGVVLYSIFVWWLAGNPLAWAEGHIAWGREYTGLAAVVSDRYRFISHAGFEGYVSKLPYDFLNALGVIFVLSAVWPVYRRLGLAYAVFILVNILPPLAAGGLLSAGRFSSVLFPVFIWFAASVPERHRGGWIASFAAFQALAAVLFYTWRPLY